MDTQEGGSEERLSTEKREELRLARRCFDALDRLTSATSGYPPGHPVVEEALDNLHDAFNSFFYQTDSLVVRVAAHQMILLGTRQAVWTTEAPDDVCFALNRDGIFLLKFFTGLNRREIRRFSNVLNRFTGEDGEELDSATVLFDENFTHIDFEALDESLAWLGGLDVDVGTRDSEEERRAIDRLFEKTFDIDGGIPKAGEDEKTLDAKFEAGRTSQAERQRKVEMGSPQMLGLPPDSQRHIKRLKQGFLDAEELDLREGEMMSALLAANPKPPLREAAVDHIADVLVRLLDSDEPWDALAFLKIIHRWRDDFDGEVVQRLRDDLRTHLTDQRIGELVEEVASAQRDARQAILQLFNALSLDEASRQLVTLLEWGLAEEIDEDIYRYLSARASKGLSFIDEILESLPETKARRILDIAIDALPATRPFLLETLHLNLPPEQKADVLQALKGQWEESHEIRDYVVPMLESLNSEVRIRAIENISEGAPAHVRRILSRELDKDLTQRPDEEVETLVNVLAREGGQKGIEKLESIIHRRGFVNEKQRELAAKIAKSLIQTPTPPVARMLREVADDWLVPGTIRSACEEVCNVIE